MDQDNSPTTTPATPPTAPPPPPPPPAPGPAAPAHTPAAEVVVKSTRTEREIDLERQLSEVQAARRKAETDAAYAQDEARRLKEIQAAAATAAHRPAKAAKDSWLLIGSEEE